MNRLFDVSEQAQWEPSPVFLRYALATLFLGAIAFIGVIYLMTPDQTGRYVGPIVGVVIAITAWALLHSGRLIASVKLLAMGTWALATLIALTQAGARTPVVAAYPVIIFLFGWLFNARAAVMVGVLTAAAILAMIVAESAGLRSAIPQTPAAMYAVVEIMSIALSVFMINFLVRSYKTRLDELKRASLDLARHAEATEDAQRDRDIAVESTQMILWQYDVVKDWINYDEAHLGWLGQATADAPHTMSAWEERLHPDDKSAFLRAFSRMLKHASAALDLDYRVCDGVGGWVWLHSRGRVTQRDASGRPLKAVGGSLNITERKSTEERVLRSETLLRAILDAVDEGILVVASDGNILSVNRRFQELWQVPQELVQSGQDDRLLRHMTDQLTDRDGFISSVQRLYGSSEVARDTLYFKDGRVFARFTQTLEVDGVMGRIWSFKDVSEANHLTASLAESQKLLKAIIDTVPVRIFWKDQSLRYLGCNPAFAKDAGLAAAHDLVGKSDAEMGWRDQAQMYMEDDRRVMHSGVPKYAYDEPQTTPDGRTIWIRTSKVPLRNEADEIVGVLGVYDDITERKQAEMALRESESRANALANMLRLMCDNVPDMIWAKDLDNRYVFANVALCDVLLCATDTDEPIGKDDMFFAERQRRSHPDNPNWHTFGELCVNSDVVTLQNARASQFDEFGLVRGEFLFLDVHKAPFVNAQGAVIGVVGSARDVTAQRAAEDRLQQLALVLESSSEGLLITDPENRIVDVNPAFTRITGYAREEVIGKTPGLLSSGKQSADFYRAMWEALEESGKWQGEVWNRHKDGQLVAEWLTINSLYAKDGSVHRRVALFSDITEKKNEDAQILRQAQFDTLTDLPNRVLLADRLRQGMAQARRRRRVLAVAFLDLDGFKAINDQYGHATGDQMLIALAAAMQATLRESDTLARIGGDEFVAVLVDLPDTAACAPMLSRLLAAAAQSVKVGEQWLQVSASVGVTFHPQRDEVEADQLLRQADQAMYQAKLAGKNRYHVFDPEQDRSVRGHHESLDRIRNALAHDEFVLHYQPKVNMRTGTVVGVEALIRWQQPDQGLLAPGLFLPAIENHPLAIEVGEWVMHAALTQMEVWQAGGMNMKVSVNVGARQLQQANFMERLSLILAEHPRVNPADLAFEVLETSALADMKQVSRVIDACGRIGVKFALDDFGTGYSSLTYLKRLQVAQLKIDQSFVRDMLDDPDDLAILEGVIGLAAAFRREVIAEGMETVAHGTALLQLGCELAQGYGIARPMPADQLPSWVAHWRPDAAWCAGQAPGAA